MTPGIVAFQLPHLAHGSGGTGWAGYLAISVVLLAVVSAGVWLGITAGRHKGPGPDDSHGGDDGGGPTSGPNPPIRPSGIDPEWWPEFERQFAAYVEQQRRQPLLSRS